jgi:hypothetical protein
VSIENVIRHIIEHHNQNGNDFHHRYWHEKLEHADSDSCRQIVRQMDHSQHHIGDFYRTNGMRIDLNRESNEATAILKVINFIIGGLTKDEGKEDRSVEIDEKLFFEQQAADYEIVDEFESELLQYQQIYCTDGSKSRKLAQMDLLEEVDIKAIAVSILAETNGSVKMAKDILTVAGMKIIKRMNVCELKHLRSDLQSISTQTDANVKSH